MHSFAFGATRRVRKPKRNPTRRCAVLFVAILVLARESAGSGWNDYQIKIDERYGIVRANSFEITITRSDESGTTTPLVLGRDYPGVGPLYEVAWNERALFAKHEGTRPRASFRSDDFPEFDESVTYWFTIDRNSGEVAGPFFDEQEFLEASARYLGPDRPRWMTRRQAYRWSMRTYPDQPEVFLRRKVTAILAPIHGVLLGVVLAVTTAPIATIAWLVSRRRGRTWPLWRYWSRAVLAPPLLLVLFEIFNTFVPLL